MFQTKPTTSNLEIALRYAAQGYSVIPVRRAHDKKERIPLIKWGTYQTQRPTPDELRSWWATWPTANPVIVCGALSGIIAIDVDGPEGLSWLIAQGLPATLAVSRGAKSRYHFWFKHPGFKVSNRTISPEVEVKGDGGLIPCPGALHWSGAPYFVARKNEIAACPDWLIAMLRPVERPAPRPYQPGPDDDQLISLAVDALSQARSENREDWLAVLMALHSAGEQYRALGHTFSARCPDKYNPRAVDTTWNSFKRGGIGLGSLFYMADQDNPGWRPRRAAPEVRQSNISPSAWADLPAQWPDRLPIGVISAALLCGCSQIVLALIARDKGYQPRDQFFADDLIGQQLEKTTVHRALKNPGAVVFVAKVPIESDSNRIQNHISIDQDSQGSYATNTTGRRSTVYTLRSFRDVITDLEQSIADHLLRLYFPGEGKGALIPADHLARLVLCDDPAALAHLQKAVAKQDSYITRRTVRRWRQAVGIVKARLYSPEAVSIPGEWHNVKELRRYFVRAIHEADPTPRAYWEWSLLAGVSHRSVNPLLTGAGLKNEAQTIEVPIDSANPVVEAKKAAFQTGRIEGFKVALPDGTYRRIYAPLEQAAESISQEIKPGARVSALLRIKSKQTVVGKVQGIERRERLPLERRQNNQSVESATQARVEPAIPRLRLPVFEAYRRDIFILAYERNNEVSVPKNIRQALSPIQAQRVLTSVYLLSEARLLDKETGEVLEDFYACSNHTA